MALSGGRTPSVFHECVGAIHHSSGTEGIFSCAAWCQSITRGPCLCAGIAEGSDQESRVHGAMSPED